MKTMKFFLCLILVVLLSSCNSNYPGQDIKDDSSGDSSAEISVSEESEPQQTPENNDSGSSEQQTYKKTVKAHTNFELENGGFEPEFTVTLENDTVLEGEGDNLTAVFPDENRLSLGWCFIYEIKTYDKYDNPLYYYENPEESLGYISHEMVTCGSYECMRIMCQAYSGKEESDSVSYRFDYFIKVNESEILSLSFFAPNDLESTLETQENFIPNIER